MNSLLHFPSFSGCRAAGARAAGTPLWRNRVHHRWVNMDRKISSETRMNILKTIIFRTPPILGKIHRSKLFVCSIALKVCKRFPYLPTFVSSTSNHTEQDSTPITYLPTTCWSIDEHLLDHYLPISLASFSIHLLLGTWVQAKHEIVKRVLNTSTLVCKFYAKNTRCMNHAFIYLVDLRRSWGSIGASGICDRMK